MASHNHHVSHSCQPPPLGLDGAMPWPGPIYRQPATCPQSPAQPTHTRKAASVKSSGSSISRGRKNIAASVKEFFHSLRPSNCPEQGFTLRHHEHDHGHPTIDEILTGERNTSTAMQPRTTNARRFTTPRQKSVDSDPGEAETRHHDPSTPDTIVSEAWNIPVVLPRRDSNISGKSRVKATPIPVRKITSRLNTRSDDGPKATHHRGDNQISSLDGTWANMGERRVKSGNIPTFSMPSRKPVPTQNRSCLPTSSQAPHVGTADSHNVISSAVPGYNRARSLFLEKQEARRQRRILREAGDYLGVTGANPYTGMLDNITPRTSIDMTEFRHGSPQSCPKGSPRGEEKRRGTGKRTGPRQPSKLSKESEQWSSAASPNLSPIVQSQSPSNKSVEPAQAGEDGDNGGYGTVRRKPRFSDLIPVQHEISQVTFPPTDSPETGPWSDGHRFRPGPDWDKEALLQDPSARSLPSLAQDVARNPYGTRPQQRRGHLPTFGPHEPEPSLPMGKYADRGSEWPGAQYPGQHQRSQGMGEFHSPGHQWVGAGAPHPTTPICLHTHHHHYWLRVQSSPSAPLRHKGNLPQRTRSQGPSKGKKDVGKESSQDESRDVRIRNRIVVTPDIVPVAERRTQERLFDAAGFPSQHATERIAETRKTRSPSSPQLDCITDRGPGCRDGGRRSGTCFPGRVAKSSQRYYIVNPRDNAHGGLGENLRARVDASSSGTAGLGDAQDDEEGGGHPRSKKRKETATSHSKSWSSKNQNSVDIKTLMQAMVHGAARAAFTQHPANQRTGSEGIPASASGSDSASTTGQAITGDMKAGEATGAAENATAVELGTSPITSLPEQRNKRHKRHKLKDSAGHGGDDNDGRSRSQDPKSKVSEPQTCQGDGAAASDDLYRLFPGLALPVRSMVAVGSGGPPFEVPVGVRIVVSVVVTFVAQFVCGYWAFVRPVFHLDSPLHKRYARGQATLGDVVVYVFALMFVFFAGAAVVWVIRGTVLVCRLVRAIIGGLAMLAGL
ncbi:hypothetical protein NEUTE2DRAFT_61896 [Neurospora tetrasperma FGSC 2509]|nr:hypothetical protein NEUTE2DRAFT_61896 [Neurospora tetrasperma FGSC 2509]